MVFNELNFPNGFPCPCCELKYKLIEKFYDGKTKKFYPKFYADNKPAQKLYQYDKEKYNKKKEPLYYYADPTVLKNGGVRLVCEKCEATFEISAKGEVKLISKAGEPLS